jgi:hypothetical protein
MAIMVTQWPVLSILQASWRNAKRGLSRNAPSRRSQTEDQFDTLL